MKTIQNLQYNVIFRPEPEGGYTVIVPSLSGCITYGKDLKEAKVMIHDAISAYIATLIEDKELIPSDNDSFISSIPLSLKKKVPVYA